MAAQLLLQAHTHHAAASPQFAAGHVAQGAGMADAPQPAPAGELAADAPHVFDGDRFELAIWIGAAAEVEDAPFRWAGFGDFVGQLGQHLGGGDAHRHRQPQPALHVAAQLAAPVAQVTVARRPLQAAEGLID